MRHAVFSPHWYKTPFVGKHEDAHSRVPAKLLGGPNENEARLGQEETVLRVDIREFDTMHVTLQVRLHCRCCVCGACVYASLLSPVERRAEDCFSRHAPVMSRKGATEC